MLDQSFTADNFRKIFDYENRKGLYLEGIFFPEVEKVTKDLKKCAFEFKELKKQEETISTEEYEEKKLKLNQKKEALKKKKDDLLTEELEKISSNITSGNFNITLSEVETGKGKPAYSIDKSPSAYFAVKQIQHNIKKLYKVKQGDRYNIICQLREVLNNKFPKYIVRTDIKDFYESIPREKLLRRINDEPLLTLSSKKLIRQILNEFDRVSGKQVGIPRGIGISAYLSELYMRSLDEAIKSYSDVIFYARYVDDIIVVFAPRPNAATAQLLDSIKNKVYELGLALNEDKTKTIDLMQPQNAALEYLGYTFSFGTGKVELKIAPKKVEKYKQRIKYAFDDYQSKSKYNETQARKLLVKRIRFLTGNTRLLNNKKNAVVGIYFSNSLVTNTACLNGLDNYLSHQVNQISSPALKARLGKMSFIDGFTQKRFSKFSTSDFSQIVAGWKHAA